MEGKTETTFGLEEKLTKSELSKIVAALSGEEAEYEGEQSVSEFSFAVKLFGASPKSGIAGWIKSLMFTLKIAFGGIGKDITRGLAAQYIFEYGKF